MARQAQRERVNRLPSNRTCPHPSEGRLQRSDARCRTDPEVVAAGTNTAWKAAQSVAIPSTVNGKLDKPGVEHYYKFHASKGQKLVLEVQARRFESPLDSELEVLTSEGKPIEVATIRAISETSVTLRDHDSMARNIRLSSVTGLEGRRLPDGRQ